MSLFTQRHSISVGLPSRDKKQFCGPTLTRNSATCIWLDCGIGFIGLCAGEALASDLWRRPGGVRGN